MLIAIAQDLRVIMVKFADRLHNLRTLGHLREDKRRRIAKEQMETDFTPGSSFRD